MSRPKHEVAEVIELFGEEVHRKASAQQVSAPCSGGIVQMPDISPGRP
jgi:hypothetical protein